MKDQGCVTQNTSTGSKKSNSMGYYYMEKQWSGFNENWCRFQPQNGKGSRYPSTVVLAQIIGNRDRCPLITPNQVQASPSCIQSHSQNPGQKCTPMALDGGLPSEITWQMHPSSSPRTPQPLLIRSNHFQPSLGLLPSHVMARTLVGMHPTALGCGHLQAHVTIRLHRPLLKSTSCSRSGLITPDQVQWASSCCIQRCSQNHSQNKLSRRSRLARKRHQQMIIKEKPQRGLSWKKGGSGECFLKRLRRTPIGT